MKKTFFAFGGQSVRSLLVVAMMIITASFGMAQETGGFSLAGGRFGEVNLKFGYEFEGGIRGNGVAKMDEGLAQGGPASGTIVEFDQTETQPTGAGFSLGAEYLFAIPFGNSGTVLYPGFLKIGAGIQYLFPRTSYSNEWDESGTETGKEDCSFLPIYAIVQVNPAKALPGLFFKGMVGYSLLLSQSKAEDMDFGKKGGLHWGFSAGYETAWGFFLEYAYTQTYYAVTDCSYYPGMEAFDINLVYSKSGVSIGYKIRL
jgi:hypothetical protein